ncbi:hypothetical protein [Aldersonia kunmingensis]|uniref:hypothetical protein n=1 Tax=Aldersonia kunmingensis TaxID=408066 RepID=UPI0008297E25|nr:hypothetical protein [Aldersonia kunmingensis]
MANGVGLWIGASESTAVIIRDAAHSRTTAIDSDTTADVMSTEYIVRDTVLYMSENGTAIGSPGADDATAVSDFIGHLGDPDGVELGDGMAYQAADLYATAVFCLLDIASADLHGATNVVAAYPPQWPDRVLSSVRESLAYLGLRHVTLRPAQPVPALTDGEPSDDASTTATPAELAYAAAAVAVSIPDDPPTDEIPVVPVPITEEAYSALMPAVSKEVVLPSASTAMVHAASVAPSRRNGRTPLLVAAGFAAAFALATASIAFALRTDTSSEVPPIAAAPAGTIQPAPRPADIAPMALPALSPIEEPVVAEEWTPDPIPAPVADVSAPPAMPLPLIETSTTTVAPVITPTTTAPAITTPPTTPPEMTEHDWWYPGGPSDSTTERRFPGYGGFDDSWDYNWFDDPSVERSAGAESGTEYPNPLEGNGSSSGPAGLGNP